MGESPVRYGVVFERPYSDADRPETLVRWRDGAGVGADPTAEVVPSAEVLTVEGIWRPTTLPDDALLGLTHDEVVPVGAARAQALMADWHRSGRLAPGPGRDVTCRDARSGPDGDP